ncbi:tRNA pseudouridine(55) synthase TruB [Legionella erythra]|uniref:tRNA pseudouridine synthase B n=1 Tax=Legionella erythra TaxID=448 RepID=A0A0W0TG32_LEGER|nr:tRNA pseudouridine(55) synthase TruB [Legionella erythra]KTC94413.1 tRNA pseudouridine synthase B [Legionella erythra]
MSNVSSKEQVDGVLLVNKPQGLSSNAVLQRVKRLYNAEKAGHTGSLDPLATGMLPVCFGEATKFSQYALDDDKTYEATGLLGIKTTTSDAMGEIIARVDAVHVTKDHLQATIQEFIGLSHQTPSMFSALKHQGTPLYKYARNGIDIERASRAITIKELLLLDFDGQEFKIRVSCSKGTYIRNLVEDIGDKLNVGAHVTQLHRLYTAGYSAYPMYTLDMLQAADKTQLSACLLPMETTVRHFPCLSLTDEELLNLRLGRVISPVKALNCTGEIRLYDCKEQFAGLGFVDESGAFKVKRLLSEQAFRARG